jgi:N-acetylglutamate synthase-like GNAT family acetyltransferase
VAVRARPERFSEKGFYLAEFRGRSLAVAARAEWLAKTEPLEVLLAELAENATRVVLISTHRQRVRALTGGPAVAATDERFEAAVWRALARRPHVGVAAEEGAGFPRACREIAQRLGLAKLVWVDPEGGVRKPDGTRNSFVDLEELARMLRDGVPGESEERVAVLRETQLALGAGIAAVNLTTLEGLADELFTYAGTGTLFTRERYVLVKRLGLDDYDAAHDLVARGVAEGYLAPRSREEIEDVLASGFGAFVEGRHLAGIGALLEYPSESSAELACLYTITRFLGEGIGGYLVRFALERARERGLESIFACTTSERVAGFFERWAFARVDSVTLPAEKWRTYHEARRARLVCLRRAV